MKITSYLMFNGEAEAAANFYAETLGGHLENLYRYSDFPAGSGWDAPDGYEQKIGHCCIVFPGGSMSIADTFPSDTRTAGNGHLLTLACDSAEQAETIYAKFAADARKINCPMQEVFYAKRYGELVDRFGILWAVMYEK